MKRIITSVLLLVCAIFVQSCGRNTTALCRIQEDVYHNGWKTCAELIVRTDRSYAYVDHNVFEAKPGITTYTGVLPDSQFSLLRKSVHSSGRFANTNGIPTYAFGIEDSKTRHPEGVIEVMSIVHDAHVPVVIEEKKDIPTKSTLSSEGAPSDER